MNHTNKTTLIYKYNNWVNLYKHHLWLQNFFLLETSWLHMFAFMLCMFGFIEPFMNLFAKLNIYKY